MAASEVQISNLALANIGINTRIADLNETSTEAATCSLLYEPCRDFVLADFPWHFAETQASLAQLETPPEEWGYKYQLPADCLSVRYLKTPGIRTPNRSARVSFKVAQESDGLVLYSDLEDAQLVYTRRIENPNLFTPQFVLALAAYLGSQLAMPLSVNPDLEKLCLQKYGGLIAAAGRHALSQSQEDMEPDGEFVTARS